MNDYNYLKTESWWLKSKTFNVEVKHWYTQGRITDNMEFIKDALSHKWNVYIYVFSKHPFFDKLKESQLDNYPFLEELHYGCTYCDWSRNLDGEVTVKKYGSDYMHLHDDHFENADCKEKAREVFFDAERLYDSFKESENENIIGEN